MPEIAQATITVTPVMKGAQQTITNDLSEAAQPAGEAAGKVAGASMSEAIGKKMTGAGTALTKGLTGPITAAAAGAVCIIHKQRLVSSLNPLDIVGPAARHFGCALYVLRLKLVFIRVHSWFSKPTARNKKSNIYV